MECSRRRPDCEISSTSRRHLPDICLLSVRRPAPGSTTARVLHPFSHKGRRSPPPTPGCQPQHPWQATAVSPGWSPLSLPHRLPFAALAWRPRTASLPGFTSARRAGLMPNSCLHLAPILRSPRPIPHASWLHLPYIPHTSPLHPGTPPRTSRENLRPGSLHSRACPLPIWFPASHPSCAGAPCAGPGACSSPGTGPATNGWTRAHRGYRTAPGNHGLF